MVHGDVRHVEQCLGGLAADIVAGPGNADRNCRLEFGSANLDRPRRYVDQRSSQFIDPLLLSWGERGNAGEFVASQPRDQRTLRHCTYNPTGNLAQDLVTGLVTVGIIDAFEIVEIKYQEGNFLAARVRCGDQSVSGLADAAAVEAAGQRISFGEHPCLCFGFAALCNFDGKHPMTPPAK